MAGIDEKLILIVAVGACLLVLILLLWLSHSRKYQLLQRQMAEGLKQVRQDIQQLTAEQQQITHQIEEAVARTIAVARNVASVQDDFNVLGDQLREVKQQDPNMRLYQRAADMVKQGASVEEVIATCDIPRAEAELLINLHRQA